MLPGLSGLVGFSSSGVAPPSWSPVTIAAPNANSGGWAGYNIRHIIKTAILPAGSFNLVRFSIQGGTVEGIKVTSCYIGVQMPGVGNTLKFNTTPTQVLWNGGSATVTVGTSAVQFTDTISLVVASGDSLLVSFFIAAADTATDTFRVNTSVTGMESWFRNAADEASSQVPGGGYSSNGLQCHFKDFELSP